MGQMRRPQSAREIEFSVGNTEFELPVGSPMGCLGSCWVDTSLKVSVKLIV